MRIKVKKVENCSKFEDGVVTKAQLWNLMQKLDLSIEREEYENFWSDLDKKSDGKLTFDEFLLGLRWIQKVSFYNFIWLLGSTNENEKPNCTNFLTTKIWYVASSMCSLSFG